MASDDKFGAAGLSPSNLLDDAFIRLQEAERLHQQRKFDQARAICESLIRSYPNYVGALYRLGLIYSDQNNNANALDCLVNAAMLDPRNGPVLTALGEVYLRFGANETARQTLEQVKQPDARVLLMLGDIYQEDCEYVLARETYRRALAVDAGLVAAAVGLGWSCTHLGDYSEAAKIFEVLIERGTR